MYHLYVEVLTLHKSVTAEGRCAAGLLTPWHCPLSAAWLGHSVGSVKSCMTCLPFMDSFPDSRTFVLCSLSETEVEIAIKASLTNTKPRFHVALYWEIPLLIQLCHLQLTYLRIKFSHIHSNVTDIAQDQKIRAFKNSKKTLDHISLLSISCWK